MVLINLDLKKLASSKVCLFYWRNKVKGMVSNLSLNGEVPKLIWIFISLHTVGDNPVIHQVGCCDTQQFGPSTAVIQSWFMIHDSVHSNICFTSHLCRYHHLVVTNQMIFVGPKISRDDFILPYYPGYHDISLLWLWLWPAWPWWGYMCGQDWAPHRGQPGGDGRFYSARFL